MATVVAIRVGNTSPDWFGPLFLAVGLGSGLTTGVAILFYTRRERLGLLALAAALTRVWREPTGAWVLFLFGWLLTLPLFALQTTVLLKDPDSARLLASVLYVQHHGPEYLVETQETLLPHLILSPAVALGGIPATKLVSILSLQALAGVVAFLAWRLNRSVFAALVAVLALTTLTAILERAFLLPMYPLMLALGFLGVYLARRATVADTPRWRWGYAAAAGLCLFGSIEAHQVGQLFLVLTAFLVLAVQPGEALRGLSRVSLAFAAFYLPRAVINLMEGGLSHFFSNRVDFWLTEGYLVPIQRDFWDLARTDYPEWFSRAPEGLLSVVGWGGILTVALGTAALAVWRGRIRRFAVVWVLFFAAVVIYLRLPFYPRYFSILTVGACLGASATLAHLLRSTSGRSRRLAVLGAVLLAGFGAVGYYAMLKEAHKLQGQVVGGPYNRLAALIPPDQGVIGTRANYLNFTSTDVRAYGEQFLSEKEYVTFLTWPSDEAVLDVMRRHDARWVFVPRRPTHWVSEYHNIWLRPAYGKVARYPAMVATSPAFCRVRSIGGVRLYRLNLGGPPLKHCAARAG
jgi:hypothetical protein